MTSTEQHNARYMLAMLIAYDAIRCEKHRLMYMRYDEAQAICKEIVMRHIQPFIECIQKHKLGKLMPSLLT